VEEARHILELGFAETISHSNRTANKQALQLIPRRIESTRSAFYAQRKTRNYAKRQITWWRREPGLVWLRGFGEEPGIVGEAEAKVRAWLG